MNIITKKILQKVSKQFSNKNGIYYIKKIQPYRDQGAMLTMKCINQRLRVRAHNPTVRRI